MSLLEEWRRYAYAKDSETKEGKMFWAGFFNLERGIYEQILANPDEVVRGTVRELAKKFDVEIAYMVGFLDGINDSLYEPNPIDTMTEDTQVNLGYDKEKLYYNMVAADADWLYGLPVWDTLLTKEKKTELYRSQKTSKTIIKGKKIGRNDPCGCGSGKKYKYCCGR